ncbi:OmpH family outer membrane protein [Candidatus Poribacteria bacterium]|nr:OmpH family outer membrane protein [Candidatus Poribacteria bacterium]
MNQFLKFYLGVTVILFGSLCLGLGAAAENNFKLGVVDTQRVFENFAKAQEANEILKNAQDKLTNQLRDIQQQIDTMVERLEKQKLFLDAPETQALEADIGLKRQELQRELENGQDSIMAKREELLAPLTQEIEGLLRQVGESEGYSLILEKRLVTLYVDPKYDLTERVLKLLNDASEKEKSKDAQQSATPPETETGKEGEKNN